MDVDTCLTVANNYRRIDILISRIETWLYRDSDVYVFTKNIKIHYPNSDRVDAYRVRLLPEDMARLLIATLRDLQERVEVLATDYGTVKRVRHILGTLYRFLPWADIVWSMPFDWGRINEYVIPTGYVPIVEHEFSAYSCKLSRFIHKAPRYTIPFVLWVEGGAYPVLLGDWDIDDLNVVNQDTERIPELLISKPIYF